MSELLPVNEDGRRPPQRENLPPPQAVGDRRAWLIVGTRSRASSVANPGQATKESLRETHAASAAFSLSRCLSPGLVVYTKPSHKPMHKWLSRISPRRITANEREANSRGRSP